MKSYLPELLIAVVLLAGGAGTLRAADKKDSENLPGTATWELKAFDALFRVARTEYDADRKQVRWMVRTRDGYRTSDFVRSIDRERPFTFTFFDEDEKELAVVRLGVEDFHGIPRERVLREGTPLEIVLRVPSGMPRVKKVVLTRGRVDR